MKRHHKLIVDAMFAGAYQAQTIAHCAGLPLDQTYARLHELKRSGCVRSVRLRGERTPSRHYRGERTKRYLLIRVVPVKLSKELPL